MGVERRKQTSRAAVVFVTLARPLAGGGAHGLEEGGVRPRHGARWRQQAGRADGLTIEGRPRGRRFAAPAVRARH